MGNRKGFVVVVKVITVEKVLRYGVCVMCCRPRTAEVSEEVYTIECAYCSEGSCELFEEELTSMLRGVEIAYKLEAHELINAWNNRKAG